MTKVPPTPWPCQVLALFASGLLTPKRTSDEDVIERFCAVAATVRPDLLLGDTGCRVAVAVPPFDFARGLTTMPRNPFPIHLCGACFHVLVKFPPDRHGWVRRECAWCGWASVTAPTRPHVPEPRTSLRGGA
jgi:hypothetical protein